MDVEKELAAAQLAAYIDTDGCVYASAQHRTSGLYVSTGVTFYNTNRSLVEHFSRCCRRLGITVPEIGAPRRRSRENHKPYYALFIRSRRAIVQLLSQILRYLVAKRAQAAWVVEIARHRAARNAGQPEWLRQAAARVYMLNDDRCQSRARVIRELVTCV